MIGEYIYGCELVPRFHKSMSCRKHVHHLLLGSENQRTFSSSLTRKHGCYCTEWGYSVCNFFLFFISMDFLLHWGFFFNAKILSHCMNSVNSSHLHLSMWAVIRHCWMVSKQGPLETWEKVPLTQACNFLLNFKEVIEPLCWNRISSMWNKKTTKPYYFLSLLLCNCKCWFNHVNWFYIPSKGCWGFFYFFFLHHEVMRDWAAELRACFLFLVGNLPSHV